MICILVCMTAHADSLEDLFMSINKDTTSTAFKKDANKLGLYVDFNSSSQYRASMDKKTAGYVDKKAYQGSDLYICRSFVEVHFNWKGKLLDYMYFDEGKMIAGYVYIEKEGYGEVTPFHGLGCFLVDYNKNEPGEVYESIKGTRTVSYMAVDSIQDIIDYQPVVIKDSFDSLQNVFLLIANGATWEEVKKIAQEKGLSYEGTDSSTNRYNIAYSDNVTMRHYREPGSYISVEVFKGEIFQASYHDIVLLHRKNMYADFVKADYWGKSIIYNYPNEPGIYLVQNGEKTKCDSAEQIMMLMNAAR